jgi:hypothetical protein
MSSLETHIGGASNAKDCVVAQASNLASSRTSRRRLMVWQAYIDESEGGGALTLAGYVAPAENWLSFSKDWAEILPLGTLGRNGYHFKWQEMTQTDERRKRVPAFYRIIEKHVQAGISITIARDLLLSAKDRILIVSPDLVSKAFAGDIMDHLYLCAYFLLIGHFHQFKFDDVVSLFVPPEEKVDFIFDDRSEKGKILFAWEYLKRDAPYRNNLGATPRFESDDEFLPLQAADFLAGWVREKNMSADGKNSVSGLWSVKRPVPRMIIEVTEDMLVEAFLHSIAQELPEGFKAYDRAHFLSPPLASNKESSLFFWPRTGL